MLFIIITFFFSSIDVWQFSPFNVSVLTQAAPGLCAAGTWFHEASLLLCEGITRSRAGQAEAGVQHGGSANQAGKRGEPS